jgi:hypothetical protein
MTCFCFKDIKGGKIYSLENCVVITFEENHKLGYEKQQREILVIVKNDEIKFKSVSEASRKLNLKRPTIHYYLKTGKQHSSGYRFQYCD